jgi:hypothetical protein
MRVLAGVLLSGGMMIVAAGCAARDVDATPTALSSEVDRCTVGRFFNSCTLPTADPAVAALAIEVHEVVVAIDEISARTLSGCVSLARTYGVLEEEPAPEEATLNAATLGARVDQIARVCGALAAHLRTRTPRVYVELRSERCFQTTRTQCSRTVLDVTCSGTLVVENDPPYLDLRQDWEQLVIRLPRRTDETARLGRSLEKRLSSAPPGLPLCDSTAIDSSRKLLADWGGPLSATEAALLEVGDAIATQ